MNGLLGWESLNAYDVAFVDQFDAEDINPGPVPYTVDIAVHQFNVDYRTASIVSGNVTTTYQVPYDVNQQWANYSFVVAPRSWNSYSFTVPTAVNDMTLVVTIDGVPYHLDHHTLPSLIPFGTLSVGAVELIVAAVLLLAGLMTAALVPVAKRIQGKGQRWAPKPKLFVWVPVVLIIGGGLMTQFYAQLDFALNAWVYVIIPIAFAFPMFFWLLRFFNLADIREVLKADDQKGLHLRFHRWERMFCELDGELYIVWETWRGWLYALILGHGIKVTRANTQANAVEGPPWAGTILYEEKKRKPRGVIEDFKLVGARSFEPGYLYFVDSDRPVEVVPPHLSMHRDAEKTVVDMPAEMNNGVAKTRVVKVQKLCRPYIVPGHATLHLAGIHWEHVVAVALNWITAEKLSRMLEIEGLKNTTLRGEIQTRAYVLAETLMDAFTRMMGRPDHPMTPEEAREEIQSWGRSFDPLLGGGRDDRRKDSR